MKRIFLFIAVAILTVGMANAKAANQVKVYINPGHGSWGSEDRNMALVNKGLNDTTGFYESNTNIRKGLALYHKLRSYGLVANGNGRDLSQNVVMSHVRCNPAFPAASSDGTYSRALSVIATEAQNFGADMFISVHSNAISDGTSTNYPLILYRGTDSEDRSSGSKAMGRAVWPYAYGNGNQVWSHYSLTNMNIRGDVSYMGGDYSTTINGVTYYGYYGVLRHGIPGFLIEGYFHTYQPSRHRAMNWDVDYIEGYSYARGIADYFSVAKESTGDIYGLVRSAEEQSSTLGSLYTANSSSDDVYLPLNGATVTLKNSGGTTVATYTTDNFYNGAFVFKDIAPGTYSVTVAKSGYVSQTKNIVVTAATTNYGNFSDGSHNFKLSRDTGGGGGGGSVTVDYTGMTTHNPFAYDVSTERLPAGIKVYYKLVGRPTQVDVELYNGSTLVMSKQGDITANTNSVYFPMVGRANGTYKAKVKVTGSAITAPARVKNGSNNEISYKFYAPWGVTCNNYTESATFGRMIIAESYVTQQSATYQSGSGNGIGMGLYAFTPTFQPIKNSNNTYGFRPSNISPVAAAASTAGTDLRRVKYTEDGRLYIGRSNRTTTPLWKVNPDNLSAEATEVFAGNSLKPLNTSDYATTGGKWYTSTAYSTLVVGPIQGMDFIGSGSNLKLIVASQTILSAGGSGTGTSCNYNGSGIYIYNLGNSDSWRSAPSINPENVSGNNTATSATAQARKGHCYVNMGNDVACGQYNFYVSQYRGSPSGSEPAHMGYDYTGLNKTANIEMTTPGGGMAFNKDHIRLAKGTAAHTVSIYNSPGSDGMLGTAAYTISNASGSGNNISGLAWDYADNLYVVSNSSEIAYCYAIPRSSNVATTPARSAYDIAWTNPPVYVLGNYDGHSFVPNLGSQMNYDSNAKTYTIEGNFTSAGDGYSYFSFSHALSSSSSDWSSISGSRFGADSNGDFWVNDEHYDTPLSLKYWGDNTKAFRIPAGSYRLVVNFAADAANPTLTITRLSYNIEAWQPSANYTVDEPVLLGTRSYSDYNASIGVSNGLIYTLHQYVDIEGGTQYSQSNFRGFFGGINRNGVDFTAVQSSNISGTEYYMLDRCSSSDDAGNIVLGAVSKASSGTNQYMRATGLGQGMDRFMIIPANGGGIGNTTVAANQSVTFGIGGAAVPDRSYMIRATGDFSSSQGGYIWILPHDASVIWRGGYKNVTTSGGQIINGTLIYTGFTASSSTFHSANPYGEDGVMLSVHGSGLYDGKVVGSYYPHYQISNNARHAQGQPSMFIIQDHKLLVCGTGSNSTASMGLFDVTNDASGNYSMSQIGNNMVPFNGTIQDNSGGNATKAIPVDDLTWDIYSYSGGLGFSQYRIHLSPKAVTAGSGSVSNNGTSQSKTITWTKASGTTPVGYNVEVSTDGGTTWATAASFENVTTESWTDTDASRATLDCKYRVSAVYDSYTSTAKHASAPCAVMTVNAQRASKAVSNVAMSFTPLIGTSTYNATADLVGLSSTLTWTRPKSITNDNQTFPATSTGDHGFGITAYRITVSGSDGSYATDASGNVLNAFSVAATGAMAGDNLSLALKNVKRAITYTATVEPVYSYLPTSAATYGTSAASPSSTWTYPVEGVQNFSVNTYVQHNAPFQEWWGDHSQTVYYDVYRVEITLDAPQAAGVPVSYYKLEMSTNNGSTWVPVTDRTYEVASGQSGAVTTTYPSYDGVPTSCWHGNHDFTVRSKPDAGFANNVNIGFYHFVAKGLSPASFSASPRAAETPTPDNWQYRITTYYGSSPSAIYEGSVITPDVADVGSYTSEIVEASEPVITGIDEPKVDFSSAKVYPNPTQGALNIISPEPIETVRIVSISGALMRKFDGNRLNSMSVDIADLGRGNYFVIINNQKPIAIIRN